MENEVTQTQRALELPASVKDLRVAGILDELSERFFPYECKFNNLDARAWEEQIEAFNPHILFVESVWNGYQKTWWGKLTGKVSNEIIEVVNWCKERKIPTVFWNKEDPIYTFTFLGTAFLFDYVFTTDMDCVPLYKRLLGHNRVGVLPFATCIQLYHPLETFERKDSACFAGSYYAKFKERAIDFDRIADILIENYKLEIYDRNPYPDDPLRNFPARFRPYIVGTLPVDQIDIAYKSYKLGVTLNIVKNSSTMEARRIFELLSCNTLTISNICLGIKNLFGDLVLYDADSQKLACRIQETLANESIYQKLRLLGLRKVLKEHTYKERLEYLYFKVFGTRPQLNNPKVCVFSIVNSLKDVERVKMAFDCQNYAEKRLFLFARENADELAESDLPILSLNNVKKELEGVGDYYAYFSSKHYYGANYLVDLALSIRYAAVTAVGKCAHYSYEHNELVFTEGLGTYCLIDRLQVDRAMFAHHALRFIDVNSIPLGLWLENVPCLSIDAYNFCENYPGNDCPEVDDLTVNDGIPMSTLYRISDSLTSSAKNYSLGARLSGEDLCEYASIPADHFRVVPHPLNYFGFYALGGGSTNVFIDRKIYLQDIDYRNRQSGNQAMSVFVNAHTSGEVSFHIQYFSETNEDLGTYRAYSCAGIVLPVPEGVHYLKFLITVRGNAYGLVKEVLIGPQVVNAIDLSAQERAL